MKYFKALLQGLGVGLFTVGLLMMACRVFVNLDALLTMRQKIEVYGPANLIMVVGLVLAVIGKHKSN